jgi:hypothetical protein
MYLREREACKSANARLRLRRGRINAGIATDPNCTNANASRRSPSTSSLVRMVVTVASANPNCSLACAYVEPSITVHVGSPKGGWRVHREVAFCHGKRWRAGAGRGGRKLGLGRAYRRCRTPEVERSLQFINRLIYEPMARGLPSYATARARSRPEEAYNVTMTDAELTRISSLEDRLDALAEEVTQLRVGRSSMGMARSHRCPACAGTKLIRFCRVQEASSRQETIEFSLQKHHSIWSGVQASGARLEAYACRSCMLVEWHAATLADVVVDGVEVMEVDGGATADPLPSSAPYR